MASEKCSFSAITSEFAEGLQISSDTDADNGNLVAYSTDWVNECDTTVTQKIYNEDGTDTETISDWEQFETTLKFNNSRKKCSKSSAYEDQRNFTYRKICSKEKVERKLPSTYYKLDKPTTLILEKLMDVRYLGQYHDVIAKGTYSVVISAGFTNIKLSESFTNAVKIYKLSSDKNLNKAIYKRAEREFEHLNILRRCYSMCKIPYPVGCHKNMIVMSMIGSSEEPAKTLESISADLYKDLYNKIIFDMKYFFGYQFVHGKLCAKNILVWQGCPYYVGWSHSIWTGEPSALKKLMRDCYFVTKYFKIRNVPVMSTEALFQHVSGLKNISSEILAVIHKKDSNKAKCYGNPNRNGEFK